MTQGIPRDLGVTPWPGEGRAGFSHLGLAGELFVEEKEFDASVPMALEGSVLLSPVYLFAFYLR